MLSVIVCSHNPRPDYLTRTLEALRAQTLSVERWELLLIDNASDVPLSAWDISWHPKGRHIHEPRLGLTPARIRGVREAAYDLLVLVDDDNVLAADYLEQALDLALRWPILGAWGGEISPEFEAPPADWTKIYWHMLAIRQYDRDLWSNLPAQTEATPCGAGMVVRRQVAMHYAELALRDPIRMSLDRKGVDLSSCGDTDLALTSVALGLGTGYFCCLRLTHLIARHRVSEPYLRDLLEKITCSTTLLGRVILRNDLNKRKRFLGRMFELAQLGRMDARTRAFAQARRRGLAEADRIIAAHPTAK